MTFTHRLARRLRRLFNANIYERLYEAHAALNPGDDAVGEGSYDHIGRVELALLVAEGLRPDHTLFDFGCGNGRLAVHAVPYLTAGRYVGMDIAKKLLRIAAPRAEAARDGSKCGIVWEHGGRPVVPARIAPVDFACAFSVFTHVEPEDTFRYLRDVLPGVKPGGKFIFSCLPLDLELGRTIFRNSAAVDFSFRWSEVRNVATSVDMMSAVAELAGWRVVRWYKGDEPTIPMPDGTGSLLGQSCCVLVRPAS